MEIVTSDDLDTVTGSDAKWAGCRFGLEILERLVTSGHHLQGQMIKNYLEGIGSHEGALALVIAKVLDFYASVDILESIRARIGAEDAKGNNILHTASREDIAEKVRLILQTERKLLVRTEFNGYSALHMSAQAGTLNVMRALLSFGANPSWREPSGLTPLHLAVDGGHLRCAELLLNEKAPIDAVTTIGETPLFLACKGGHVKCVSLLIEKGANVNLSTRNNQSPLHVAAAHDHSDCIYLLLRADADAGKPDHQRWTPLHSAADGNCVVGIGMLLAAKVDINAKTDAGKTAVHICAAKGRDECLKVLLQHEPAPNLNERDKEGRTALQTATANRHSKCIELLRAVVGQQ